MNDIWALICEYKLMGIDIKTIGDTNLKNLLLKGYEIINARGDLFGEEFNRLYYAQKSFVGTRGKLMLRDKIHSDVSLFKSMIANLVIRINYSWILLIGSSTTIGFLGLLRLIWLSSVIAAGADIITLIDTAEGSWLIAFSFMFGIFLICLSTIILCLTRDNSRYMLTHRQVAWLPLGAGFLIAMDAFLRGVAFLTLQVYKVDLSWEAIDPYPLVAQWLFLTNLRYDWYRLGTGGVNVASHGGWLPFIVIGAALLWYKIYSQRVALINYIKDNLLKNRKALYETGIKLAMLWLTELVIAVIWLVIMLGISNFLLGPGSMDYLKFSDSIFDGRPFNLIDILLLWIPGISILLGFLLGWSIDMSTEYLITNPIFLISIIIPSLILPVISILLSWRTISSLQQIRAEKHFAGDNQKALRSAI